MRTAAGIWERFCNSLFGINGVVLSIGVLGFLSSVVTLFVDIDSQISVRWVLLVTLVSLIVIFVLLGLLGQPSSNAGPPLFEVPIKFQHSEGLLIIKRNENFTNTIIVGCYVREGDIERLAFVATVEHTQEKCIQLRIVHNTGIISEPEKARLKDLVVKPFIPAMILEVMRGL